MSSPLSMRVIRHLERTSRRFARPVVTLGVFDGVHVGHGEILDRVVAAARSRRGDAVVITFFPHPAAVLAPDKAPPLIASLADRLAAFRARGADFAVVKRFTREFSRVEAEAFVERTLIERIGAERVIVGHNVSFGRGRRGNADLLRALGERHGFEVEIVGPVVAGGKDASSSAIRRLLSEAEIEAASSLLGRPYSVAGRVVVGKRRGRTIGFPTANLRPRVGPLLPDGVYAVFVDDRGVRRPAVANVGHNPTFGDLTARSLEAHLLDYSGDLYGRTLRVEFVERIRGERRFDSVDDLVAQIGRDAERARAILAAR